MVETATTDTERLARVREAIEHIESGEVSQISIAGRALTKLGLEVLYSREATLLARIAAAGTPGRKTSVAKFRETA